MSCEQDKDEAFWLSRDSREASSFFAIKAVCHSLRFIHASLWLLCEVHLLAGYHSPRFIHAIMWLLCDSICWLVTIVSGS